MIRPNYLDSQRSLKGPTYTCDITWRVICLLMTSADEAIFTSNFNQSLFYPNDFYQLLIIYKKNLNFVQLQRTTQVHAGLIKKFHSREITKLP